MADIVGMRNRLPDMASVRLGGPECPTLPHGVIKEAGQVAAGQPLDQLLRGGSQPGWDNVRPRGGCTGQQIGAGPDLASGSAFDDALDQRGAPLGRQTAQSSDNLRVVVLSAAVDGDNV